MKVVLDTNVLVSALMTPTGPCASILALVLADVVTVCVDARILAEYAEALQRPRFKVHPELGSQLLDYLHHAAEPVLALPLADALPDPDDLAFLEVALAARADYLVTGNARHFPQNARHGIAVLAPREFLDGYQR